MPTIAFPAKCHACDALLTGCESRGTCPQCHRAIAETVDDRLLDLTSGSVIADVPCVVCVYDLRTLAFDARCPECGTPVSRSLLVEELRFCDPGWMSKVRLGLTLILVSILASLLVGLLAALLVARAAFVGGGLSRAGTWMLLPSLAMNALMLVTVFYLTTPKPGEPPDDGPNRAGRWARIALCLAVALSLLGTMVTNPMAVLATGTISRWNAPLGVMQALLFGVTAIGSLIVLARIAVLARRPGLRTLVKVLGWCIGSQTLVQALASLYAALAMPTLLPGLAGTPFATQTVSYSSNPGAVGFTVTTSATVSSASAPPALPGPATSGQGSPSPTAPGPGTGGTPVTPAMPPPGVLAALTVFGCVGGVAGLATFVLGLTAVVKFRTLLATAISNAVRTEKPVRMTSVQ